MNLTAPLKQEYQRLFDACQINAGKLAAVDQIVTKMEAQRPRYEAVGQQLSVPWHFIAAVHCMEASLNFTRHLHNGDPLTARTKQVPANRPTTGSPPFTWEASATDALRLKRLHHWTDWTVPGLLYKLEEYNGWGYRKYRPHVPSPYLWSFSGHYTRGKYVADGRWSETAVSQQCGCAVLLRRMAEKGTVTFTLPPPIVVPDAQKPLIGYSSTEVPYAKDLQQFLNKIPGVYLLEDGKPGQKTSDALKLVTGHYLHGDPRGAA